MTHEIPAVSASDAAEAMQTIQTAQRNIEALAANRAAEQGWLFVGLAGLLFLPFGSSMRPSIDAALALIGIPVWAALLAALVAFFALLIWLGLLKPNIPFRQSRWLAGVAGCSVPIAASFMPNGFILHGLNDLISLTWVGGFLNVLAAAVWAGRFQGMLALSSLTIFALIWKSMDGAVRFNALMLFSLALFGLGLWFRTRTPRHG